MRAMISSTRSRRVFFRVRRDHAKHSSASIQVASARSILAWAATAHSTARLASISRAMGARHRHRFQPEYSAVPANFQRAIAAPTEFFVQVRFPPVAALSSGRAARNIRALAAHHTT